MVQNKLTETLSEYGVTPEQIAEHYRFALDEARESGDLTNLNRTLEKLVKLLDMKPEKSSTDSYDGGTEDWRQFIPDEV